MATATIRLDKELVLQAKAAGLVESRSAAEQIEYWAKIGKAAEDNPDLDFQFIRDALLSLAEAKLNMVEEFRFDD